MKTFLFSLLVALMSFGMFASPAAAQSPAGTPAQDPVQIAPGPGRDITHAVSTAVTRFEGLTNGGTQTSGVTWRQVGDHWQKSGTWVKVGDNVETYADDGTKVFTQRGAGNFSNTTGPTTVHLGDPVGNWTAV